MADIKTILRELSVILGIILARYNLKIKGDLVEVKSYLDFIRKHCSNIDDHNEEVIKIEQEGSLIVHKDIIENGINLGKLIHENLNLEGDICWVGSEVKSKYPFDITVGAVGISLKEDSYILKNPSFADYLNALTQPKQPLQAVHVFRQFASQEFTDWFDYSYGKLVKETRSLEDGSIILSYSDGEYFIKKQKQNIVFGKGCKVVSIGMNEQITEKELNFKLGGDIIEHTFSKWIKSNLEKKDKKYLELKKKCSVEAGSNLVSYVNNNLNIDEKKILSLFQIYDEKYFYGKIHNKALIYEVPTNRELKVTLDKIEVEVPESQLNVHFSFLIENTSTSANFKVRVECRYSHGQFKGIPEAKLYYTDKTNDLKVLYKLIIEKP